MENPENNSEDETPSTEEPIVEQQRTVPTNVVIQTPLDRPEFDFFLTNFMKRTGIGDKKEAAIMLTNMFTDLGLDPYADLKDLTESMKQMNEIIKNLPNTPASLQVKDTLSAQYAAKAGRAMLNRMPQTSGDDPMEDRITRIMDKYLPMIMAFKMLGNAMNEGTQTSKQEAQQPQPQKFDLPPEYKEEMATIKQQIQATQELLKQQSEEKKNKEFADNIITTVHANISPQLEELRNQVATLTNTMSAQQVQSQAAPSQSSSEMKEIAKQIEDLVNKFSAKAEAQKLNLSDIDTVLSTLDSIEKRIKREPTGEIDWKSSTITTIGEIGKEFVNAYKDIQAAKSAVPQQYGPPPQPGSALAPAANEMKQIVKRQVQQYIVKNLEKGISTLDMNAAMKDLNLSGQQIYDAYKELEAEGWIKTTPPSGTPPPNQQLQPTQTPEQQIQNIPQQQPKQTLGHEKDPRFDPNSPFLER